MDLTYIIPILWIAIYVVILVTFITKNERLKKEVSGLESENRRLRLDKVFQPISPNEKQFYEFRINVRNDKIEELERENKALKNIISSLKITDGIPTIINGRYVVDDRTCGDNLIMSFPPMHGKTLYMNEIRQQHFNDIVSKMKSDVEERFMKEDSSNKPTDSKCCDTQPKMEKTLCAEDLFDIYEAKKDIVQMFRYFTGYGKDIKVLMDYIGCQAHELDLVEGWMTFKRLMDNTEFKVNNGDCIVVINHKDISVITYRDFTSKYTKKEG